MTTTSLTLPFGLPGYNEMIQVARGNKYASAKQKKKYTKLVEKELIAQHCIPDKPLISISVDCIWTESRHARDPDNIRAGIKYVLDAMVNTGVLKDDSMKYVKFLGDTFQSGDKRMVEIRWEE
jgi:Holliday junction resolvase RusA-like endonuclease